MTDFDLNTFLKNYQPKSLVNFLAPYMHHKKLANYTLMEHQNKSDLVPTKTYIKYINIDDAIEGKFRSSHIKAGGILIGCGRLVGKKFIQSNDSRQWRILQLKFDPSAIIDNTGRVVKDRMDPIIFHININKCYVFYKHFDNGMRDFMKNARYDVELIDSKGNVVK